MRKILIVCTLLVAAVIPLVLSCSDDGSTTPDGEINDYVPDADGSTWTYNVIDNTKATYTSTETINGTRDVNGTSCQILERVDSDDPNSIYRTFFFDNDTNMIRIWGTERVENGTVVNTIYYNTGVLVFVYPLSVGSDWEVISVEGSKPTEIPFIGGFFEDDDLDNDGTDDTVDMDMGATVASQGSVTVPAGTFEDTFKIDQHMDVTLHLTLLGDISVDGDQERWFKPYVGNIKNHLTLDYGNPAFPDYEETSELASYSLP